MSSIHSTALDQAVVHHRLRLHQLWRARERAEQLSEQPAFGPLAASVPGSMLLGLVQIFILYAAFCISESFGEWTEPGRFEEQSQAKPKQSQGWEALPGAAAHLYRSLEQSLQTSEANEVAACICGHDEERRETLLEALSAWTPVAPCRFSEAVESPGVAAILHPGRGFSPTAGSLKRLLAGS